jgi:soluble lytic murein transglycosylase-like protein
VKHRSKIRSRLTLLAVIATTCPLARAAEHITLRNGFELDCARHEITGNRIRLYLAADSNSYIEYPITAILRTETIPDPPPLLSSRSAAEGSASPATTPSSPTPPDIHQLLTRAGATHNIDADLLASIVHAESNGNARAVSRAGAQGLMQLMPSTAAELGVQNSFAPDQNIGGGTAYLDQLLTRYDPNNDTYGLELAVAAYNAGPAAVDRYHGIPPYAETRAYVARVIREFNRLKRAANPQLTAAK